MTTSLEKIVRPAQLLDVSPPRKPVRPPSKEDRIVTLRIDLAGSGASALKTLTGNYSFSQSKYVEAFVNEAKTPF